MRLKGIFTHDSTCSERTSFKEDETSRGFIFWQQYNRNNGWIFSSVDKIWHYDFTDVIFSFMKTRSSRCLPSQLCNLFSESGHWVESVSCHSHLLLLTGDHEVSSLGIPWIFFHIIYSSMLCPMLLSHVIVKFLGPRNFATGETALTGDLKVLDVEIYSILCSR